jgi:hypothetical protein
MMCSPVVETVPEFFQAVHRSIGPKTPLNVQGLNFNQIGWFQAFIVPAVFKKVCGSSVFFEHDF